MEVMENPERSPLDLFNRHNLENQRRLAKAYREGGRDGLLRELQAIHHEKSQAGTNRPSNPNAQPSGSLAT